MPMVEGSKRVKQNHLSFYSSIFPHDQQNLASSRCDLAPHKVQSSTFLLISSVVVVTVSSFILSTENNVVSALVAAEALVTIVFFAILPAAVVIVDDAADDRSFIKSKYASARFAACAGIIATPAKIDAITTNLPDTVTGLISPKPTVVSVVNPKYNAVK